MEPVEFLLTDFLDPSTSIISESWVNRYTILYLVGNMSKLKSYNTDLEITVKKGWTTPLCTSCKFCSDAEVCETVGKFKLSLCATWQVHSVAANPFTPHDMKKTLNIKKGQKEEADCCVRWQKRVWPIDRRTLWLTPWGNSWPLGKYATPSHTLLCMA